MQCDDLLKPPSDVMEITKIKELISKYASDTASKKEVEELNKWYHEVADREGTFPGNEAQVYQHMRSVVNRSISGPRISMWKYWVAASLTLFFISGLAYFHFTPVNDLKFSHPTTQLRPSKNPTLILSNGTQMNLDAVSPGTLSDLGGISIIKSKQGQLIYRVNEDRGTGNHRQVSYNTLKTPYGSQYQLLLPDGSKVWLNAASSLTFPTTFSGLTERKVELTGEAYFEVVHNEKIPFRVITRGLVTEDLGTKFNVSAYLEDQDIRTTLVQGAARVTAGGNSILLRPGEQAKFSKSLKVVPASTEEVTAWMSGYFRFDAMPLDEVMNHLSRWYNVSYTFNEDKLKKQTYGLVAPQSSGISELLEILQQTGNAEFILKGTHIVIQAKR